VFCVCLCSLNPFVFSCCFKLKPRFTMVFMRLKPLVSHLSPTLSPSYCLRCKCAAKNRNHVA
jgi:hypothetical protein